MRKSGQIVLFEFPQTDLQAGKLRPALVLCELPGHVDDWSISMISSHKKQAIPEFDELIEPAHPDFAAYGLKMRSVIRVGRMAVVEGSMFEGVIGERVSLGYDTYGDGWRIGSPDRINRYKESRIVRIRLHPAVFLLLLVVLFASHAQAQPARTPPPDYEPVSINMEDVPYPYPVQYIPLTLYGQNVRMAYMDVQPPETPNGRTIVLFHGLNFFGEYWHGTIDALRDEGFRVIAVDQIGFGRSSKPIIPYTLGDKTLNIRTLLDSLGISEAAVMGHSMGGIVATRFALLYPEATTHLVLVNQIGMTDQRLVRPWRRTDEIFEETLGRDYEDIRNTFERYYVEWRPEYERHIRIHYGWTLSGEWPRLAMIRALNRQLIYTEPVVYDWPHIQARTLVIGGEEDGPDFPDLARTVAESIPDAELVLFPDVGHNPHLEAPHLLHPELIRFLTAEPD